MHPRKKRTYGYSTATSTCLKLIDGMPHGRQSVFWNGRGIGSETHSYVLRLLNSRPHPEQSYRFCLGLLNLHKKYE